MALKYLVMAFGSIIPNPGSVWHCLSDLAPPEYSSTRLQHVEHQKLRRSHKKCELVRGLSSHSATYKLSNFALIASWASVFLSMKWVCYYLSGHTMVRMEEDHRKHSVNTTITTTNHCYSSLKRRSSENKYFVLMHW